VVPVAKTGGLVICFRCFQSGFRQSHSTATALTKILDGIHLAVEIHGFSVALLLGFSKAFDSILHGLLLRKLKTQFGLSSTACRLISSFLKNVTSETVSIDQGSPQGSILSPVLFASFINDVCSVIKHCRFHLYADDLQITTVGSGNLNNAVGTVNK
jgi:retron-type reverse transcriptase